MLRYTKLILPRSLKLTKSTQRCFQTSSKSLEVFEIKSMSEFQQTVSKDAYSFVDFYATWCAPCKAISPILEKLSDLPEYTDKGIKFYKVDVDTADDIAMEYGITAMPTFLLFKNGTKEHSVIGANPPAIKQLLDSAAEGKI